MVDSTLSIIVRDTKHPCAPYQSTRHSFYVSIFTCDLKPLHWKGMTYVNFPLNVKGQAGGLIHAQVKVPPGCYLVRALATCKNVVSDWAWVELGCGKTACVNLVIPNAIDCLLRTVLGLQMGTVDPPKGEATIREAMPKEVEEAIDAMQKVIEKLPKSVFPPPPTPGEIRELEKKKKTVRETTEKE